MSPNRKADLQRKLAMAPIPKPPAGLAERIKSDIPQHLLVDARKERERLSRSIAFNLRVAASVILLIGSVYLALRFLTTVEQRTAMEKPANVVMKKAAAAPPPAAPARVAENAPPPPAETPKTEAPAPKPVIIAEAKSEPLVKRQREEVAGGRRAADIEEPATPTAAPPPPPPVPAPPQQSMETADAAAAPRAAAKVTSGLVASAVAEPLTLTPATLFDIVVPKAGAELDDAALIQHFAAPPSPPRALRLDAEATMLDETPLLRVSVDVPEVPHPEGGSQPPVAADAKLDIVFNDDVVASHRAIAGKSKSTASVLPSGSSVSALFAIELKPGVARRATIANVKLRYRSVADAKERTLTLKLRRSDLSGWGRASRRMKGASLAAALVESLESKEMIVEKARAAGLDELAEMVGKR